jgi:hypothetical protein
MNVASLEYCKELQDVSHWIHGLNYVWCYKNGEWEVFDMTMRSDYTTGGEVFVPAYDLGYIFRKLPSTRLSKSGIGYRIAYLSHGRERIMQKADTPEDAACKLAIELFKQGILVTDLVATDKDGTDD